MYENYYACIREGKASLQFDNQLASSPLAVNVLTPNQPKIKVRDYWKSDDWNIALLIELVGEETIEMILASNFKQNQGSDSVIQKINRDGSFSNKSMWEMIRIKGKSHGWMKGVWHKLIPKKMSLCMWKEIFHYFSIDNSVQQLEIHLVSACNCCAQQK